MTNVTEFTINVVAELATIITVTGEKSWGWRKAAKAALELAQEEEIKIHADHEIEIDWEEVLEEDTFQFYNDWEVTLRAKISLEVTVLSKNLEEAEKAALELAESSVEITSTSDVDVDWYCY